MAGWDASSPAGKHGEGCIIQAISPAFQAAIATGYQAYLQADVLVGGVPAVSGLSVSDGQVVLSRGAAQRRTFTLSLTLDDPSLIPSDNSSAMAPFGSEVQLFAGWIDPSTKAPYIIPSTGMVELVSQGIFAYTTGTPTDTGSDLTFPMSGYDRSWSLSQRKFKSAFNVTAGTAPETAIQDILAAQYPSSPALSCPPTGFALPAMSFTQGSDPWQACLTIAAAAGLELFYNAVGVPTALPTPNPGSAPTAWTYADDGSGNAPWSTCARSLTRENIFNDFIVSGTGSQITPCSAEASDTNPLSPTYTGGGFGDVPSFPTSSSITDSSVALAAAQNALTQSLGSVEVFTLTASPAPMFDVDDVVGLVATRLLTNCKTVVDGLIYSVRHDTKTQLTLRRIYSS